MLLYIQNKNLYQAFFDVFFIKSTIPKIDTLVCPDW